MTVTCICPIYSLMIVQHPEDCMQHRAGSSSAADPSPDSARPGRRPSSGAYMVDGCYPNSCIALPGKLLCWAHPIGIFVIPPVLVLHIQLLPHMQPSLLTRARDGVVQYEGNDQRYSWTSAEDGIEDICTYFEASRPCPCHVYVAWLMKQVLSKQLQADVEDGMSPSTCAV